MSGEFQRVPCEYQYLTTGTAAPGSRIVGASDGRASIADRQLLQSCGVFNEMAVVRIGAVCLFVFKAAVVTVRKVHSGDQNPGRWAMLEREIPSRWWWPEVGSLETMALNELQLAKCSVPCLRRIVFL